jgi:regulatory protein
MKQPDSNPKISVDLAQSRAMKLCSQQEYAISDIRKKLISWELEEAQIEEILKNLQQEKFLDDYRYALAFVRDKMRFNKWGAAKIRLHLQARQVEGSIIDQAIKEGTEHIDQREILRKELQKKMQQTKASGDYEMKMKLLRFAYSRGFSMDLTNAVLDELINSADFSPKEL